MKKLLPYLLILIFASVSFADNKVPGQYIIKYKSNARAKSAKVIKKSASIRSTFNLFNFQVLDTNQDIVPENFEKQMMDSGEIEFIEYNYIHRIIATPNDPDFPGLWGIRDNGSNTDVDAQAAWEINKGSKDVVIGVIDTGINYNHPDLEANMWRNPGEIPGNGVDDDNNGYVDDVFGINAINNSGNPMDDHKHGTHCAGTIGAVGNNSIGVVGVNWNVSLMGLKFLDSNGFGDTAHAIKLIEYAIQQKRSGVNLVALSNSWGGGNYSRALEEAIAALEDEGILFIAAAGNDSSDNTLKPTYPANYSSQNIISVAAIDRSGNLAPFSNYGYGGADVAAPGVAINSTTLNDGYELLSGTSMAAPHVSGVAGLLFSQFPNLSMREAKDRITNTVKVFPTLENLLSFPGIVSADRALRNEEANLPELPDPREYSFTPIPRAYDSALGPKLFSGDDDHQKINLPFEFPYYGETYNQLFISSNGVVYPANEGQAYAGATDYQNRIARGIAVYNDDLFASALNGLGGVYVKQTSNTVTISWIALSYRHRFSTDPRNQISFQVKLHSNGIIDFRYQDLDFADEELNFGTSGSVGVAPNARFFGPNLTMVHNERRPQFFGNDFRLTSQLMPEDPDIGTSDPEALTQNMNDASYCTNFNSQYANLGGFNKIKVKNTGTEEQSFVFGVFLENRQRHSYFSGSLDAQQTVFERIDQHLPANTFGYVCLFGSHPFHAKVKVNVPGQTGWAHNFKFPPMSEANLNSPIHKR